WLIQDACDNDLTADPYTCTGPRHNLRPGEVLYYDRHDQISAQIRNSFPLATDAETIVHTFDFGPFDQWDGGDGYDLVETSPPYASIIDTRDPGGASTFVGMVNGNCVLNDGWLLFPTATYAAPGSTIASLHMHPWER